MESFTPKISYNLTRLIFSTNYWHEVMQGTYHRLLSFNLVFSSTQMARMQIRFQNPTKWSNVSECMVNKSSKNKSMNVFVCVCVVYIDSETCRYQIYTEMKMKIQYLQKDLSHTPTKPRHNSSKHNKYKSPKVKLCLFCNCSTPNKIKTGRFEF